MRVELRSATAGVRARGWTGTNLFSRKVSKMFLHARLRMMVGVVSLGVVGLCGVAARAAQQEAPPPVTPPVPPTGVEAPAPEARALPGQATLEEAARREDVSRQQFINDIRERLQAARQLTDSGQPEAALNALRLALDVVRSSDLIDAATKSRLDREIQTAILSSSRAEEMIVAQRAERLRLEASATQQQRSLDLLTRNQDTVRTMFIQFNGLMAQGQYNVLFNGGFGDITATTAPFYDARLLAQQARALIPADPTPRAGMFVSSALHFFTQSLQYEILKEYRFMMTMYDVDRASVPHPDNLVIEYPAADRWRDLSERRIKRWGAAVDLVDRSEKTKSILEKLEQPIAMSFPNETPLEDVLKYIKSATQGPNDTGIPIYVDPVGLHEAEKTMTSPITIDLEGVPLRTTLKLILKQLDLTYTVKDGMMTITSRDSEDVPTEIRVYPVADLAIIPFSLMGGGGMGGRGGMGGMGGGMGGMGGGMGGMGGMGGGMGGMGGGMGMMSVAPTR
jgi:hypothetical protein